MPLLDHFHPPLREQRHWESFHAAWLGSLADALNRQLPKGYFAEEQTHAGARLEIDVATFREEGSLAVARIDGAATATLPVQAWSPPAPGFIVPAAFADDFEIRVFSTETGPQLVAAIELISPANKDRPEARRGFAAKCASYLYQGVGLIIVDIVTERQANLHSEIMDLLHVDSPAHLPTNACLYAVAYRPIRREAQEQIDIWPAVLVLGGGMPVLPLAIHAELCLPVDLEATYTDACHRRRIA